MSDLIPYISTHLRITAVSACANVAAGKVYKIEGWESFIDHSGGIRYLFSFFDNTGEKRRWSLPDPECVDVSFETNLEKILEQ